MKKQDSILTNFRRIDYEGLKMDQNLMDFDYINISPTDKEEFISFEDIYFGLISMN